MPPAGARSVAARVLVRVWHERAYAAPSLDAELRRHGSIDARDARLATELVYGVLRTGAVLERAIDAHAPEPRWRRRPLVRAHMLLAAYCIHFLDRVPPFAAVSEAVSAIAKASDRRVAAFANAVLRKLARDVERTGRPPLELAVEAALPGWLRRALRGALAADVALSRFLLPATGPPPVGVCLGAGEDRDRWLETLASAAPEADVTPGSLSPRCIRIRGAGDPRQLPGAGTAWIVQEEGAQCVALLTGAQPGERVLDACAGRGSKAFIMADAVGPSGAVDAADRSPAKLEQLRAAGARGRQIRDTHAVDWTCGTGGIDERYDRALVDAPCSGVGTLRRRPEIGQRLARTDLARLAALQTQIVRRVACLVRDGGTLVFAVCSVLREETDEVVDALVKPAPGHAERLSACPSDSALGRELAGDACSLRLLPHVHDTDGYFVACFRVQR